jgi:hypothetical protein
MGRGARSGLALSKATGSLLCPWRLHLFGLRYRSIADEGVSPVLSAAYAPWLFAGSSWCTVQQPLDTADDRARLEVAASPSRSTPAIGGAVDGARNLECHIDRDS